jgi:hypothetical protein
LSHKAEEAVVKPLAGTIVAIAALCALGACESDRQGYEGVSRFAGAMGVAVDASSCANSDEAAEFDAEAA